jgi:hypothetical protein
MTGSLVVRPWLLAAKGECSECEDTKNLTTNDEGQVSFKEHHGRRN